MPKEKKEKKDKKKNKDKKDKKKSSKGKSSKNKKSKKDDKNQEGGGELKQSTNGLNITAKCPLHGLPLTMWCMTCQEPVCPHCVMYGPHNNQLHKVIDMEAAYRGTVSQQSNLISSGLLSKRDLLLAQIHRLSYRMDEISYARSIIEKDCRSEFGGVVGRLQTAEGKKQAVIQNEMAQLQAEIERVDSLVENYDKYRLNPLQMLLRYRSNKEEVEGMIAKPFKKEITVYPYDLPRELAELRAKLARRSIIPKILKMRDNIIWNLFNNKKESEKQAIEKFNRLTAEEVKAWAGLTDKYTKDLEKFQMICYYCGEILSPATINAHCSINTPGKRLPKGFTGFTQNKPPEEYYKNKFHFFGYPKTDLFQTGQAFSNLQKLFSTQQATILKKGLLLQIEKNLAFVRTMARERSINIAQLFRNYDTKELGIMSRAKFTYLLHELLQVDEFKIKSFLELLDPEGQGMLNYNDFLELLNDPKLLKAEKEYGVREMMPPRDGSDIHISQEMTEAGGGMSRNASSLINNSKVASATKNSQELSRNLPKSRLESRAGHPASRSNFGGSRSKADSRTSRLKTGM